MLDIKFIRENKDIVQAAITNKKRDVDLDALLRVADERKELRVKIDDINQKRNEAARTRNAEEGTKLKKELEELEVHFKEIDKHYLALMLKIPNIFSPDTPIGKVESENQILREVGEKPHFDFEPKDHEDLGRALDIIDKDRAAEISGSRFAYIKGDLVLVQFALLQFCFETLTSADKLREIATAANVSVPITPFTPVLPPVFVRPAVQNRMARFMTPEEHYIFPEDDLMLIGSAEHTLGPLHMDQILEEKNLPIRYVGYSPAFRREAGAQGKDTTGIIRLHQFDKLEMETFCLPEHSVQEQNFLVAIQEYILRSLKLPYQVIAICTGDMGFPDYRQIDINTWIPSQNRYRETNTADLTGNFQSRRLNTRVKRADGKTEPVHMNDATAVAMGRTLVAIIENYQRPDGSILIPEILQKYMGKKAIVKKQ